MSTNLSGRFRILNRDALEKQAARKSDPRHVFYEAMLAADTYQDYIALVGSVTVQPATTVYAVTGPMEFRYVKEKRGWIASA
jgi:hypothetical protein